MEKIDARKLKKEAQQLVRKQVIRLRKAGKTYQENSEIVGIHKSTTCAIFNNTKAVVTRPLKAKNVVVLKVAIERLRSIRKND